MAEFSIAIPVPGADNPAKQVTEANAPANVTLVNETTAAARDPEPKSETTTTTETAPTEKQLIEGRWESVDQVVASYKELQRELTKLKQGAAQTPTTTTTTPETTTTTPPVFDTARLSADILAHGEVQEETLADFERNGFSRDFVNSHLAGQKALAAQMTTELASVAGGEAQLGTVLEWAKTNLSQSEIGAYNQVVASGNLAASKLALAGLVARHTQSRGKEPGLVGGESAAAHSGVKPFANAHEMVAAMQNPEYRKNPAYVAQVQARVAASNF